MDCVHRALDVARRVRTMHLPMTRDPQIFTHPVRVPYAHVDQMGVVYYAHYLVYWEMARGEMLRAAGMPYLEMEKSGVFLPVVESHCVYRKPARYDDLLMIQITCVEIKGLRMHIEYETTRGAEMICTGWTDHVCLSREGKVLRPVPELKKLAEMGSRKMVHG